jgi:hypothetical protein
MSDSADGVFAISIKNKLYVKFKHSGIHPLILHTDGLPVGTFGSRKTLYIAVDEVIAWHEKELRESDGKSGSRITINTLKRAKANHEAKQLPLPLNRDWFSGDGDPF